MKTSIARKTREHLTTNEADDLRLSTMMFSSFPETQCS